MNNEGACDGVLIALINFFVRQPDADFTSSVFAVNAHRGISCLAARRTSATPFMPRLGLLCRIYNYWGVEWQEWIERVGLSVHNAGCDAPKAAMCNCFQTAAMPADLSTTVMNENGSFECVFILLEGNRVLFYVDLHVIITLHGWARSLINLHAMSHRTELVYLHIAVIMAFIVDTHLLACCVLNTYAYYLTGLSDKHVCLCVYIKSTDKVMSVRQRNNQTRRPRQQVKTKC